ncbi:MAG: peptide chain release factor 3 [Deltaproteobacteria bacterium]|nr:peptide chain release factor 3 [Deltaproteobacteria bacterium]
MAVDPSTLKHEILRRRTFAIISHPDAGKTTLTEKLLLYGGAIHLAGTVKARRASRHATSDWMAIEKERGISVASSVMQFEHQGCFFNLLDTPGHNDFSEDTYRTLAAADCAVMLIDVAKGVEPQTIKLFAVCRLRKIPIVTFINKMDREGKSPLDLLDEVEQVLGIPCAPLTWPLGMGKSFAGVVERDTGRFMRFERVERGQKEATMQVTSLEDPDLVADVGETAIRELKAELALLDDAGNKFDVESFMQQQVTPVFFGSAMTNFGVEPFLDRFTQLCPSPRAREVRAVDQKTGKLGDVVAVDPTSDCFSGFVFKIQANMDPRHRDRIAFVRLTSGRFEKGMNVKQVRVGTGVEAGENIKKLTIDRPMIFMAQERTAVEEAFAGDIIGVWDPGNLRIGDALTDGAPVAFEGIPSFSPEHFVRVKLRDPLKRKQLKKGLEQLADEGAVQLFRERDELFVDPVLGAVGWLQFEVVQHRLKNEYGVEAQLDKLPYTQARWVFGDNVDMKEITRTGTVQCLLDVEERPLLLFETDWMRRRFEEKHPEWQFVAAVQPGRAKA